MATEVGWVIASDANEPDDVLALSIDMSVRELNLIGKAKTFMAFNFAQARLRMELASDNPDVEGHVRTFKAVDQWSIITGYTICCIDMDDPAYLGCLANRVWVGRNLDQS